MGIYICDYCSAEFESFGLKANHIRWHHQDNVEYMKNAKKSAVIANNKRFGEWVEEDIICAKCSTIIHIKYREGKKKLDYYCSKSCSSKRNHSVSSKQQCSKSVKSLWDNGHYAATSALNHLSQPKQFSSKVEREIVKYFKLNYPDDAWKNGGSLSVDGVRISRDLWSDKLKICFEYDGEWHFKNIHGQLQDKKRKDRKLSKWCRENKYRLIRVDEQYYENIAQIEKLIYRRKGSIIKIGNRY